MIIRLAFRGVFLREKDCRRSFFGVNYSVVFEVRIFENLTVFVFDAEVYDEG